MGEPDTPSTAVRAFPDLERTQAKQNKDGMNGGEEHSGKNGNEGGAKQRILTMKLFNFQLEWPGKIQ